MAWGMISNALIPADTNFVVVRVTGRRSVAQRRLLGGVAAV